MAKPVRFGRHEGQGAPSRFGRGVYSQSIQRVTSGQGRPSGGFKASNRSYLNVDLSPALMAELNYISKNRGISLKELADRSIQGALFHPEAMLEFLRIANEPREVRQRIHDIVAELISINAPLPHDWEEWVSDVISRAREAVRNGNKH